MAQKTSLMAENARLRAKVRAGDVEMRAVMAKMRRKRERWRRIKVRLSYTTTDSPHTCMYGHDML